MGAWICLLNAYRYIGMCVFYLLYIRGFFDGDDDGDRGCFGDCGWLGFVGWVFCFIGCVGVLIF